MNNLFHFKYKSLIGSYTYLNGLCNHIGLYTQYIGKEKRIKYKMCPAHRDKKLVYPECIECLCTSYESMTECFGV